MWNHSSRSVFLPLLCLELMRPVLGGGAAIIGAPPTVALCHISLDPSVYITDVHLVHDPFKTQDRVANGWIKYVGVYSGSDYSSNLVKPSIELNLDSTTSLYTLTGFLQDGTAIPGNASSSFNHLDGTLTFDLDVDTRVLRVSGTSYTDYAGFSIPTVPSDFPASFQNIFLTAYSKDGQGALGSLYFDEFSFTISASTAQMPYLHCQSSSGKSYDIYLTGDVSGTSWTANGPIEITQS